MRRLSTMGVSTVALAIALSACGSSGGGGDQGKITDLIKTVGKTPESLCRSYATPQVMKAVGGMAKCLQLAKTDGHDPNVKVKSVKVTGSTATALITNEAGPSKGHDSTVHLVKQSGGWKVTTGG